MKIAYCCFTDTRNIGDFALYKANQLLFSEYDLFFGGETKIQSEINLFGGGTLYPYCLRYGMFPKRKIEVAIGLGVLDPQFYGNFGFLTRLTMRYRKFKKFGVRGYRSREILLKHKIESFVTGDTALALNFSSKGNVCCDDLVGLNIVGESMKRIGSARDVYQSVMQFCKDILARDSRILLIPFCKDDIYIFKRLYKDLNNDKQVSILNFWEAPINHNLELFMKEMQKCSFLIGERLHAVVFGALLKIPFLAIEYKPKIRDFVESLSHFDDVRHIIISPNGIEKVSLFNYYKNVIKNKSFYNQLFNKVEDYRIILKSFAEEIKSIIRDKL